MDEFINSLPDGGPYHYLYIYDNTKNDEGNVCTKSQIAAVKAKDWIPLYYISGSWKAYEGIGEGIVIDDENFPDENFRNYLMEQDYGTDGIITEEEIAEISYIEVNNKDIKDLKGIEYFTELTILWCSNNHLKTLNVSKNTKLVDLDCSRNQINGEAMDALINSLPYGKGYLKVSDNTKNDENNLLTISQVVDAKAKGWIPYYYDTTKLIWKEYEATITVSVNANGLATYCPIYGIDFSNAKDIAAYKASVIGNTVILMKVETVAAGEGILLRSLKDGAATEDLPIDAKATKNYDNEFVGTLSDIILQETNGHYTNFVLNEKDGVIGFYKANNTKVAAGKAYLPVENYDAATILKIAFGDTTGISEISTEQVIEDDAIYTLGGVRIKNPTKGIYIMNGKKVVIK